MPYIAQRPDHQRLDWIGKMKLAVMLDGNTSGGRLTVIEVRAQRGDASPVHMHSNEDETFIVLEGGMTVWVGDLRHHIEAGGIGFLPRNLPHCYRFTADGTRASTSARRRDLRTSFGLPVGASVDLDRTVGRSTHRRW